MKFLVGVLFAVLFTTSILAVSKTNTVSKDLKVINFKNTPLKAKYLNKIYKNFQVLEDYSFIKDKEGNKKQKAGLVIKLKLKNPDSKKIIEELQKVDGIKISNLNLKK